MMTRRVSLGLLGAGALVVAGLPLYERVFGRRRLRFVYSTGELSDAAYGRLTSKPGWSAWGVEVAAGVRLRGLLRRPSAATAPWVLFYSGNDATMLSTGQELLTKLAQDRDFGLCAFAYRGFESSQGTPELEALAADAPVVLDKLCAEQQTPPGNVHLVGFSIGGHLAVHAARAAAAKGQRAATLSLLASVDDIVMVRPSPWEKLSPGDDYQTRPLLSEVPSPVLVIQGTADEALAGPEQGRAIAAGLGAKARYVELPDLGHQALLDHEPALSLVRHFIAEHAK